MICQKCGNPIEENSRFCTFCGAPLIQPPEQPQTPIEQQAPQQTFNQQPPMQQAPHQGFYQQPPMQQPPMQQAPQQQWGFEPEKAKSKTPLIIGIVVGAILLVLIAATVVFFLKNGKDDDTKAEITTETNTKDTEEASTTKPNDAEGKTTEETTEEETTEATTEEATEEPAYAEENECNMVPYSSVSYSGEAAMLFYDSDNNLMEKEGIEVNKNEFTASFNNLYKTEPDDKGVVTYYAEIDYVFDADFTDTEFATDWLFDTGAWAPSVVDYYTGTMLAAPEYTDGLVGEDEKSATVLNLNGEAFSIEYARMSDFNTDEYSWNNAQLSYGMNYMYHEATKIIIAIKAPKDYDGLMLVFDSRDVDYEEYKTAKESEFVIVNKLFVPNSIGYSYSKDDTLCVKLSDYATSNSDDFCNLLSTHYVGKPESSFDWLDDYYNGDLSLDRVEDNSLLNGNWNGFLWWDKDNEMGAYSEEYLNVNIYSYTDSLEMTFKYNVQRFDSSGDWQDKSSVDNDVYTGTFDADGSADLESDGVESFTMKGFYTDGYVQIAIGEITLSDGETGEVYLYRP